MQDGANSIKGGQGSHVTTKSKYRCGTAHGRTGSVIRATGKQENEEREDPRGGREEMMVILERAGRDEQGLDGKWHYGVGERGRW